MDFLLPVTYGANAWDTSTTIVLNSLQSLTESLGKFGIQLLILRRFRSEFQKLFSPRIQLSREPYIITCCITWKRSTKRPRVTTLDRHNFSTQTLSKHQRCFLWAKQILSVRKHQIVVSLITGSAWELTWRGSALIDRRTLVTFWNIARSTLLIYSIIFDQLIWWKILNW